MCAPLIPAFAADCVVTDTIVTPDGTPVAGMRIEFSAVAPQSVNNSVLSAATVTATTDASGQMSVTLLQGATVRVKSPYLGLTGQRVLVPASGTANLRTLIASYVAPGTPTPLDGTTILVGDDDTGLVVINASSTIAEALIALNQSAGSGGGGGGSPSNTTPSAVSTSGSAGAASTYSRGDHTHAISSGTIVGLVDGSNLVCGGDSTGVTIIDGADTIFDALDALNTAAASGLSGKASTSHTHAESDVTNLVSDLAGKASTTHASTHSSGSSDPITHNNLAGLTTGDPHTQYLLDTDRGATSGVASLDGSTLVPAAQLPAATTSTKGAVILATPSSDTTAGHVVQANDARLSDSRTPSSTLAHQSSHQSGGGDPLSGNLDAVSRVGVRKNSTGSTFDRRRINLIEGANVTLTVADDSGGEEVDVTIAASGVGGGSLSDGDYGDITVSSSATVMTIDAAAVTYSKIQDVTATDRILGRVSTGAGVIEELTCTDFAQSLLDDTDASTARSTLGLGTLATQSGTFSGTSSGTNTGDQTITLTGNVTGSGTGSFAATIADDAVTYAKMQNVSATDKLLGRVTAGSGDVEEVTCTDFAQSLLDDADASTARSTLGLGTAATTSASSYEVPLTFSTGLTRSTNTVTVDASQSISTLSNLTSNGFVKTSGGTGALSIDTSTYLTGNQSISLGGDLSGSGSTSITATIANDAVTNAKLANVSTATIKGRVTASTGDPEDLTGTQATTLLDVFTSSLKGLAPSSGGGTTNYLRADGTWAAPSGAVADGDKGDVTVSSSGATWTIDNDVVSNAKAANMANATIKCRTTAGTGDPEDCTATQTTALLNAVVGDSGSGGTKGLVPAPSSGDAAAGKYLKADGTWTAPSGGGILDTWHFQAESFDDADANWPTTANAVMTDSVSTASVQARKFLGASATAAGGKLRIPTGSTTCKYEFIYQASAAPGATNNKVRWRLDFRALGGTASMTTYTFADQTNANNTTMALFSDTETHATTGLTAGSIYQFQLVRITSGVTNNMTQDAYLTEFDITCN